MSEVVDALGEIREEADKVVENAIREDFKSKSPGVVVGETVGLMGNVTLQLVKTGALFMAFYMIWAWSGLTLMPLIALLFFIGALLWYIGNGIAGHGWNPLDQLSNRAEHKMKGGFAMH